MTANSSGPSRGCLLFDCPSLVLSAVLSLGLVAHAHGAWAPKVEFEAEPTLICKAEQPDAADIVKLNECSIPGALLEVPLLYGFKDLKSSPKGLSLVDCLQPVGCPLSSEQPGWALGPRKASARLIAKAALGTDLVSTAKDQPTLREFEVWLKTGVVEELSKKSRSLELVWRMGADKSDTPLLKAEQAKLPQSDSVTGCQGGERSATIALGTCEEMAVVRLTLSSENQVLAVWRITSICAKESSLSAFPSSPMLERFGGGVRPSERLFEWSLKRSGTFPEKEDEPLPNKLRINIDAFHFAEATEPFCARFVDDRRYVRPVSAPEGVPNSAPETDGSALYTRKVEVDWEGARQLPPVSSEQQGQPAVAPSQLSGSQGAGDGERLQPRFRWLLDSNGEPSLAKFSLLVILLATFGVGVVLRGRAWVNAILRSIGRAWLRLRINGKPTIAPHVPEQKPKSSTLGQIADEEVGASGERRLDEQPGEGKPGEVQAEAAGGKSSAAPGKAQVVSPLERIQDHTPREGEEDGRQIATAQALTSFEQGEWANELAILARHIDDLERHFKKMSSTSFALAKANMDTDVVVRRLVDDVCKVQARTDEVAGSIHAVGNELQSRTVKFERSIAERDRSIADMQRFLQQIHARLKSLGEPNSFVREKDLHKLLLGIVRSPPEGDTCLEQEKWLIWLSRTLPQPASTPSTPDDPLQVDDAWRVTLGAWRDLCRYVGIVRRFQWTLGVEGERVRAWNSQPAIKSSKEGEDLSRRQETALETLDKIVTIDLALASELVQTLSGAPGSCPQSLLRAARDTWKHDWSNPAEIRDFVCDWVNLRVPYLQAAFEGLPVELDLLGANGAAAREASERANASFFPSADCGLAVPSGSALLHQLIGNLVSTVGGDYHPIRLYQDQLGSKHVTELQRHSEVVSASPYSRLFHDLGATIAAGTVLRITAPAIRFRGRNEPDRWTGGFQYLAGLGPKDEEPV